MSGSEYRLLLYLLADHVDEGVIGRVRIGGRVEAEVASFGVLILDLDKETVVGVLTRCPLLHRLSYLRAVFVQRDRNTNI